MCEVCVCILPLVLNVYKLFFFPFKVRDIEGSRNSLICFNREEESDQGANFIGNSLLLPRTSTALVNFSLVS